MIDQKTATGVCDSLAHVSGPGDVSRWDVARSVTSGEGDGRESELMRRSAADDERIAMHESSHALVARLLGSPLGGVTCDAGDGFSGLCWGPQHVRRSKFSDDSAPSLCAQIGALMPGPGESRADVADIYLHAFSRVTELVAGTEGERLFLPGEPWFAADDERQAIAYAGLICSAEAIEVFINYCRAEARALLTTWAHVVHALADQLKRDRRMDGQAIDSCIERALTAKAAEDERRRRAAWRRAEESAASFVAVQAP